MNASPELRPTRCDALVVLTVLLLALALSAQLHLSSASADRLEVVVTIDGTEAERTLLDRFDGTHVYTHNGYALTVQCERGALFVAESTCPNQDCLHAGAIARAGQSIVCLPARITLQLIGSTDDYDLVAG